MKARVFTVYRVPMQGESRDDAVVRVLAEVHPAIYAVSHGIRRMRTQDVVTLTLSGFSNEAEVKDHVMRLRRSGATVTVQP